MYRIPKIIVLIIVLLLQVGCTSSNKYIHSASSTNIETSNLKQTVITPYMEAKLVVGKNTIFCSTFQLAWNEIKDNIVKEDINLKNDTGMAKSLNNGKASKKDVSDNSYVAMAGLAKDNILDKINNALKAKFTDASPVTMTFDYPQDIFAYAYLYKNLRFKDEFEAIEKPLNFKQDNVKSFGIEKFSGNGNHKKLSKEVDIFDFKNESDFIIKLKPTSKEDEVVLAKIKPKDTLIDTIEGVMQRIEQSKPKELEKNDILIIPKINFDITHNYTELMNKFMLNPGFTDKYIKQARQDILFSLDEKGAVLKSEARIWFATKSVEMDRRLVFNEPFLLYLKEKDAKYPYFAMWVDNSELMVK